MISTNFRLICTAYRARPWIERCIASIRAQEYPNFHCIVIDDNSGDGTYETARQAIGRDERFTLTQTSHRRFALANFVAGIKAISDNPDDVIVIVDGDDWLYHEHVLERLAHIYKDHMVWLTYGSHQNWRGTWRERAGLKTYRGIARAYPDVVAANRLFRYHDFFASHLRSFKRFLWDGIQRNDLLDANGEYLRSASDVATMIPMLEMAGSEHIRFIRELLYVYNDVNPIGERHDCWQLQLLTALNIRALPRYDLLNRRHASGKI